MNLKLTTPLFALVFASFASHAALADEPCQRESAQALRYVAKLAGFTQLELTLESIDKPSGARIPTYKYTMRYFDLNGQSRLSFYQVTLWNTPDGACQVMKLSVR